MTLREDFRQAIDMLAEHKDQLDQVLSYCVQHHPTQKPRNSRYSPADERFLDILGSITRVTSNSMQLKVPRKELIFNKNVNKNELMLYYESHGDDNHAYIGFAGVAPKNYAAAVDHLLTVYDQMRQ